MKVIRIDSNYTGLPETLVRNRLTDSISDVKEEVDDETSKEIVFLLGYEVYENAGFQGMIFSEKMISLLKGDYKIYSSYEAIGAYFKCRSENVDGDLQVIDIESDNAFSFTINFKLGKYSLCTRTPAYKKICLSQASSDFFKKKPEQLTEFESYLNNNYHQGKQLGLIVWECLRDYGKTGDNFEFLIAVFDNKEFADIKIEKLVKFREYLLQELDVDTSKPYSFTGIFSSFFSAKYNPENCVAKLKGVEYLDTHDDSFYADATSSIDLEVYSYPNEIRAPLFPKGIPFKEYSTIRQIEFIDTGNITLYRDDVPLYIETGKKGMKTCNFEIFMNGNQNLIISVDEKICLL